MDDILMIPVHYALLCFAVFFLEKKSFKVSESWSLFLLSPCLLKQLQTWKVEESLEVPL